VHEAVNDGFVHRATAANTAGHITTIDNPYSNGNPGAVVIVTPNWNPGGVGGVIHDHPLGVWYNGSRWTIYSEDVAAIPVNAAFNVEVSPYGSFKHVASAPSFNASFFTNPLAAPASAHVIVTHDFGPFGLLNTKASGIYHNGAAWGVYNEDAAAMTPNVAYTVFVANAPRATW
jgi:hypothetical protein